MQEIQFEFPFSYSTLNKQQGIGEWWTFYFLWLNKMNDCSLLLFIHFLVTNSSSAILHDLTLWWAATWICLTEVLKQYFFPFHAYICSTSFSLFQVGSHGELLYPNPSVIWCEYTMHRMPVHHRTTKGWTRQTARQTAMHTQTHTHISFWLTEHACFWTAVVIQSTKKKHANHTHKEPSRYLHRDPSR